MAQISYRANLSAAIYPMTVAESGRTVIVPQADQHFDRRVDPIGEQKDAGIPQAMYLENVFPTVSGYQSVGFARPPVPFYSGSFVFNFLELKAKNLPLDKLEDVNLFCMADGVFRSGPNAEFTVSFIGTSFNINCIFSSAVIRDVCYFYARRIGFTELYTVTFDGVSLIFENITATVTPAGFLSAFGISAIVGSNNYLICTNRGVIYYSSTTTPTDFVSSLVTGAGSLAPNNAEYTIENIKETNTGFIIYTQTNAIAAEYTGNARYPWKFRVLKDSGAVVKLVGQIYGDATSGYHYVIENNNQIKVYTNSEAKALAPEVTEFLQRTTVQAEFNSILNTFTEKESITFNPKIYRYLDRYIIVSINGGTQGSASDNYTHAIVYDTLLQRYGKLKVNHAYLFTIRNRFVPLNEALGFVDVTTNRIRILHFDIYEVQIFGSGYIYEPFTSVFILGKLQYVRNKLLQLEEIEVEGPRNTAAGFDTNFSCAVLPSLDGRNFAPFITPYQSLATGGLVKYNCHITAINHSIIFKGAFNFNTLTFKFITAGER